jgi:predicted MFS family arabinose efflux permease
MSGRLGEVAAPLRERSFRRQFLAQGTSVLGDNVAPLAIAFGVLELTGSATDLGLVLAAHMAALGVFLLVGGVVADRAPRQRVMVAADLARFATQGCFAALLISGSARLWQLVALQALNGAATAFFQPASTGLTPQTVTAPLLQQANALLLTTVSLAGIAGPAIAGLLVALTNPGWALAVDSLSFLGSAAFLLGVRVGPPAPRERGTFVADLLSGWSEVRSRSWIWISVLVFMLFQLLVLSTFVVAGPLIALRSLGGASAWALVLVISSVGSVAGNLAAFVWRPRYPLRAAFLTSFVVLPVLVLLAVPAPLVAIAAGAFLYGIALSLPDTLWFTVLQENVGPDAISRVSSYDWLGSVFLRPVGYALVGPVVAAIGVEPTLLGAAAVFGAVLLVVLTAPSISRLERRVGETAATVPI